MSTIREMNHITCPQTVILDLHEFSSQNIYNVQKKRKRATYKSSNKNVTVTNVTRHWSGS